MSKLPLIGAILTASAAVYLPAAEPLYFLDGLAVYRVGEGEPVLLMPYPHASARVPMAESELAAILVGLGRSVISFDPPGSFRSTRAPEVTMEEMLACTVETLECFDIHGPVDVVGHSMGSLCALAFSLEHQDRVRKLLLVGSTSGWPAVSKWSIQRYFREQRKEYGRFMWWGFRLFTGLGNLAIHKKLDRMIERASFVDKSYVRDVHVEQDDRRKPVPVRARWPAYLRKHGVDYRDRLQALRLPVLICVGRYDPQTPVVMNEELHQGIANSELVVFDHSGHAPFIEEKERFIEVIRPLLSPRLIDRRGDL